jgi:hypothetical protein
MFTSIAGLFGSSTIKWVSIGALALIITCSIGGGYLYLDNMQTALVESQKALAVQTLAAQLANQRASQIQDQHNEQVVRAETLETQRKDLSEEVTGLRGQIAEMDLEADIESDKPEIAISRLNGRHGDLNRMLERASRNLRGSAGADGVQAGPSARH